MHHCDTLLALFMLRSSLIVLSLLSFINIFPSNICFALTSHCLVVRLVCLPVCRACLVFLRGLGDTARPAVQCAACTALATLFTPSATTTVSSTVTSSSSSSSSSTTTAGEGSGSSDTSASVTALRKQEGRASVQSLLSAFSSPLSQLATSGEESTRLAALTAIKAVAKHYPVLSLQHIARFLPPLAAAIRDIHIRHKYSAERALRHLLCVTVTTGSADKGQGLALQENTSALTALAGADAPYVRDYVRRVVVKQAADSDNEGDKW